jgi:hypothetical protein
MDLLGSYQANGYTIEAYFPEDGDPDAWTLWVIRNGYTLGEFTARIPVHSVHGMDHATMEQLEAAADAAVREVLRREAFGSLGLLQDDALAA